MRCAQEGMKIVLAGIGLDSLTRTAADVNALGAETLIVQTDVSDRAAVENLAEQSYAAFGSVDLLVNNAGVASPGNVLGSTYDDWDWVLGVNLYGVLYGLKVFVPRMIAQKSECHVVNVASISGIMPGGGSYGVSKHGVLVLSESLYYDLAESAPQVKISALCPGWVASEFYRVGDSRPDRYSTEATLPTEAGKAQWQESIEGGISIEAAADILFAGLANDQLYIGVPEFEPTTPGLANNVRRRTEHILAGSNPELDR
jgi:NAD(P)-dependent dehydrogenase (short-subunit alcohol dehydrogenase family)